MGAVAVVAFPAVVPAAVLVVGLFTVTAIILSMLCESCDDVALRGELFVPCSRKVAATLARRNRTEKEATRSPIRAEAE